MSVKNNCTFIGRTGSDIEVKTFNDNNKVGNVSLAIDESYRNKEGSKVEKTTWVNLTTRNNVCSLFENYVPKGSKVAVTCRYSPRDYEDKEGQKRYAHEFYVTGVEFMDSKGGNSQQQQPSSSQAQGTKDEDDQIPF